MLASGSGPDMAVDFGGVYQGASFANLLTNLNLGLVSPSTLTGTCTKGLCSGCGEASIRCSAVGAV